MQTFQKGLEVAQNNVANANTPGYLKQRLDLRALPFDSAQGLVGGVDSRPSTTTRNWFLEQSVHTHSEAFGYHDRKAGLMSAIEANFDVTGQGGLSASLNALFSGFASLSASPNDPALRNQVLAGAGRLTAEFRSLYGRLEQIRREVGGELSGAVGNINQLGSKLTELNRRIMAGAQQDAAVDAEVHHTLEELSRLAPIQTLRQNDGTFTVLLGGRAPFVTGPHFHALRLEKAGTQDAPADARVLTAEGGDVTGLIHSGELGALLEVHNTVLPRLIGGDNHAGDLNRLAQSVADRVNQLLASGQTAGSPPVAGEPLFVYDAARPNRLAATLQVNESLSGSQLAIADPGPPPVANGIALRIANLAKGTQDADRIDGKSYQDFFAATVSSVGEVSAQALAGRTIRGQMLSQAQTLRQEATGVSLDEEALYMLQFQRSYQAVSRMVKVLDELVQDTLSIVS